MDEALHKKLDERAIAQALIKAGNTGVKADGGKARFDLIPPDALYELAKLYAMGSVKYADRNWEQGMNWGKVYAALQRHANAWHAGEQFDPTDGQHHLISVAWCAFALYCYETRNKGVDDRVRVEIKR